MRLIIYISLLSLLSQSNLFSQDVIFNEVVSNNSIYLDFEGDTPDWLELKNISDQTIDISHWHLSDDDDELEKWSFPAGTNLEPQEILLVFASGKNLPHLFHTNFKIDKDGENLFLSNVDLELIQIFKGLCIPEDKSAIFNPVDFQYYYSDVTTPNEINPDEFDFPCNDLIIPSNPGGFYMNSVNIDLTSEGNYPIYYSLDGTEPDFNSSIFDISQQFISTELSPSDDSFIPTSDNWFVPELPIKKASIIRAQTFYDECPVSQPFGETYFIGNGFPPIDDLLVFSLSTDPNGLFSDDLGIYVPGSTGVNFLGRGDFWERAGHLER